MINTIFTKVMCSLPIILLALYFFPIAGVLLILVRNLVYKQKNIFTSICFILISFCIYIPKLLYFLYTLFHFNNLFGEYLYTIVKSSIYSISLLRYANFLFFLGIFLLFFVLLLKRLFTKLENIIYLCFKISEEKNYKVDSENDLLMKEKRERAQNRRVVYCKKCGADNIITPDDCTCRYCRSEIKIEDL